MKKLILIIFLFTVASPAYSEFKSFGPYIEYSNKIYCVGLLSQEIQDADYQKLNNYLNSTISPETCEPSQNGRKGKELLKVIELNDSPGGELLAAMGIIDLLQKNEIAVEVWDRGPKYRRFKCSSACALIFAGAPKRHYVISKNEGSIYPPHEGYFGLHKPKFTNSQNTFENAVEKEKEYDRLKYLLIDMLGKVGVDAEFVIRAFETKHSNIYIPLFVDLLMWEVITTTEPYSPKNTFGNWY